MDPAISALDAEMCRIMTACGIDKNRHAAIGKTDFDGCLAASRIAEGRIK